MTTMNIHRITRITLAPTHELVNSIDGKITTPVRKLKIQYQSNGHTDDIQTLTIDLFGLSADALEINNPVEELAPA